MFVAIGRMFSANISIRFGQPTGRAPLRAYSAERNINDRFIQYRTNFSKTLSVDILHSAFIFHLVNVLRSTPRQSQVIPRKRNKYYFQAGVISSTFARHMASVVMFFRGKVLLMKYI